MSNPRTIYRRMGYLRDQRGIMNRYLRERATWDLHLEKTRAFIDSAFAQQPVDSVAVLGSGWLLDLPLEQLEKRYRHIFLVDIVHPPQVRKKTDQLDHVELVEADLTGGVIEQAWQFTRKKGPRGLDDLMEMVRLAPPLSQISPDAVISLNLLNQLDIIPCDFFEKHGYFKDESTDRFRSLVQSFHLEWITRMPGCLVTDTAEVNTDKEGNETIRSLLYAELPAGFRSERWGWEFDTGGTYRPGFRTRMEVHAVEWV